MGGNVPSEEMENDDMRKGVVSEVFVDGTGEVFGKKRSSVWCVPGESENGGKKGEFVSDKWNGDGVPCGLPKQLGEILWIVGGGKFDGVGESLNSECLFW